MRQKQAPLAPLGRSKVKLLAGVVSDPRPRHKPPGWLPKIEIEAGKKQDALIRALRAVRPGLRSRLDKGMVQIWDGGAGPVVSRFQPNPVEHPDWWIDMHKGELVAEAAPKWNLGGCFDLLAWQQAYSILIGD